MEKIIVTIVLVALFAGFGWAVAYGINKQEINDCHLWVKQAKQYAGFYLLPSEKAQCDTHKIFINAPVHL